MIKSSSRQIPSSFPTKNVIVLHSRSSHRSR